jgi:hypothetical protein
LHYFDSERLGTKISTLSLAVSGENKKTHSFNWIMTNYTQNNTIRLYGQKQYDTTGSWKITSDTTGRSTITARLLT